MEHFGNAFKRLAFTCSHNCVKCLYWLHFSLTPAHLIRMTWIYSVLVVKLVCLHLFSLFIYLRFAIYEQEFSKCTIDIADLLGLAVVLSRIPGKGHSKLITAGLGWATAEVILTRGLVLWVGARGAEFSWLYIQKCLESNISLVSNKTLSLLGRIVQQSFLFFSHLDSTFNNCHTNLALYSPWSQHQIQANRNITVDCNPI